MSTTAQQVRDLIRAGCRSWSEIARRVDRNDPARKALLHMLESGAIITTSVGEYRMAPWARTETAYERAIQAARNDGRRESWAERGKRPSVPVCAAPDGTSTLIDLLMIRRACIHP
jgi:hypothetical protein